MLYLIFPSFLVLDWLVLLTCLIPLILPCIAATVCHSADSVCLWFLPDALVTFAMVPFSVSVYRKKWLLMFIAGNTKGRIITVPLASCLTGFELTVWQLTIFCFYLQNRLIQTSQTGGQPYSDTSPFLVFPVHWYQLNKRIQLQRFSALNKLVRNINNFFTKLTFFKEQKYLLFQANKKTNGITLFSTHSKFYFFL